ncbi:hypothetical protein BS50DRAFT_137370 [Corynespora cassiicola Philippines]|uniref:Uncharacterized protein n=1 Tax=Corynespora cassiicola Philippines TaxID=1448308 RepID=A0A2T2N9F9_CORCC|nr:hypothetical protein BS50DRAFT_137370 [Corynespora cassiicola Philippines]
MLASIYEPPTREPRRRLRMCISMSVSVCVCVCALDSKTAISSTPPLSQEIQHQSRERGQTEEERKDKTEKKSHRKKEENAKPVQGPKRRRAQALWCPVSRCPGGYANMPYHDAVMQCN